MLYQFKYQTPAGFNDLLMRSDGENLIGLWFEKSVDAKKNFLYCAEKDLPVFRETCRWLDEYFSGRQPDFTPQYTIENPTSFRREVLDIVSDIPFGKTITYGEIAARIAEKHGIEKMSAQAVGGAVGWNPICLIVPCHRVVGANGKLTGYGGGINNKIALLKLEGSLFP
jgi:methylated-DNA-[protein]-cysteine S-methyltransferase